jgi:hypothetical protein
VAHYVSIHIDTEIEDRRRRYMHPNTSTQKRNAKLPPPATIHIVTLSEKKNVKLYSNAYHLPSLAWSLTALWQLSLALVVDGI